MPAHLLDPVPIPKRGDDREVLEKVRPHLEGAEPLIVVAVGLVHQPQPDGSLIAGYRLKLWRNGDLVESDGEAADTVRLCFRVAEQAEARRTAGIPPKARQS